MNVIDEGFFFFKHNALHFGMFQRFLNNYCFHKGFSLIHLGLKGRILKTLSRDI